MGWAGWIQWLLACRALPCHVLAVRHLTSWEPEHVGGGGRGQQQQQQQQEAAGLPAWALLPDRSAP
jgi:hypothetical protein